MRPSRPRTAGARLARLGFDNPTRAQALLDDPALAGLRDPDENLLGDALLADLGRTPDPDQAVLGLVRFLESAGQVLRDPTAGSADLPHLRRALVGDSIARRRVFGILGSSPALTDHLVRHPAHWTVLREHGPAPWADTRALLLRGVGADHEAPIPVAADPGVAVDQLRVAYRRRLLAIAGRDFAAPDPLAAMPEAAGELADLAAAAIEAALAIARAELGPPALASRIAVIGLGKCGAGELNYVSDVDVVFVTEGDTPQELELATKLATGLMRACSADTAEGTLWPVDANLRPEGAQGPLVRTLASHLAYYQRWAKTWEFQALLKARPIAGDLELGRAYLAAISPLVWQAAERPDFVADVQAMRRRVESHIPGEESDHQLKLGPGGIRDIEFSVQLLQLVHGRIDPSLRLPSTLPALAALAAGGYVGREDAAKLDAAYRLLRVLEHRIQAFRLRRTHLMPTAEPDLRRLGRQLGFRSDSADAVRKHWQAQAREVRRLHERLFYRPLLNAAAALTKDEASLSPQAAQVRLAALGYRDPPGALRHLHALTGGVTRRAAIQRQLLPVMLGWFAAEADPDAGLLGFRRISDSLGTTHWYLKMLRDEVSAGHRLAQVLARSRFASELLTQAPESVRLLGDDLELRPRTAAQLRTEILAAVRRHDDPAKAVLAARSVRRRELFRISTADLVGTLTLAEVERALTEVAAAVVEGALEVACRQVQEQYAGRLPTRLLVVAMGRFGGRELGYGSDADVVFVHDPLPDADPEQAQAAALAVITRLRTLLAGSGPDPALDLDADLRPEGKNGPLVRSLAAYREYYQRWSLVWEAQALLRATVVAGDRELAADFEALIEPVRWPAAGLTDVAVREIRRIKARIEAERLPRGADRGSHLKLGRGGLADVEWTVQLLQLRHAHEVPGLRHTGTLTALEVGAEADLVAQVDAEVLAQAWTLASRLRNAAVLWRGRPVDALPSDWRDLDGVARIIGYHPGRTTLLLDDYARMARRCRAIVERVFYG